jgi:hypothetical protein
MSYGASIIGASGNSLIDESFSSYRLESTHSVTMTVATGVNGTSYAWGQSIIGPNSIYSTINRIAVIKNSSVYACAQVVINSEVPPNAMIMVASEAAATTITVEVYTNDPIVEPTSGYGIVFKNASGAAVFSGNHTYLQIVDTVTLDGVTMFANIDTAYEKTIVNPGGATLGLVLPHFGVIGMKDFSVPNSYYRMTYVIGKITSTTTASYKVIKLDTVFPYPFIINNNFSHPGRVNVVKVG